MKTNDEFIKRNWEINLQFINKKFNTVQFTFIYTASVILRILSLGALQSLTATLARTNSLLSYYCLCWLDGWIVFERLCPLTSLWRPSATL